MPETDVRTKDVLHDEYNADLLMRYKNIARAYRDVHVLTGREYNAILKMDNVNDINAVIGPFAQMDDDLLGRFCVAFIGEDTENFNNAPVAILARAYIFKKNNTKRRNRNKPDAMADALARRIDEMSMDFANSGGMVLDNGDNKWPLVDINNIANVYEGFSMALRARLADLDEDRDAEKIAQMRANIAQMDTVISEYDKTWGLNKVHAEYAPKLESRWDEIMSMLNQAELSQESKEALKRFNFLDQDNNSISQVLEDGEIDPEGRAAALLELARGNVARRYVTASAGKKLNADELARELNTEFLLKLYQIEKADKLVRSISEDPEMFMNEDKREEFMNTLSLLGGDISNDAYNTTLDADVNATAGWAARLGHKMGGAKIGGFFDKLFLKNERVDRMANVRMTRKAVDRRQQRLHILKRVLKGFAGAFIASILVMTIATAVASTAGIPVAMALSGLGLTGALGISGIQIGRWRRAQRAAGAPTGIRAFLSDTRLLSSLVVTGTAVAAMCFGAAGMADTAMTLGFGALGLGALKNGAEMYTDVRDADKGVIEALNIARNKFKSGNGMKDAFDAYRRARRADGSIVKSLAAGIFSAGSVVLGGLTGRALANALIDWINTAFPDNKIFQNATTRMERQEFTKEVEHSKTVTDYTDEMTQRAERAVNYWYRNNPELLQQNIDAVNQYNAENGTDINPYRALRIMDMCDPNRHGTYTAAGWQRDWGFTPEQINMAAHAIGPNGTVNPEGMEIVRQLDLQHMGKYGEVGAVHGHEPRYGDVYRDIQELPTQRVEKWMETETDYRDVPVTDYNRAHGNNMAAVGNYTARRGGNQSLGQRIEKFWNGIKRENYADVPQTKEETKDEIPVIEPVMEPKPEIITEDIVESGPIEKEVIDIKNVEPLRDAKEKVLEPVYTLDPENTPVITPVLNAEPEFSEVYDSITPKEESVETWPNKTKILGLTRSQAKAWRDLNARLKKVRKKLDKSPQASKAAKLHAQESKLTYYINNLCNQLGHSDYDEITRAAYEELLREDLNEKNMLIKLANEPTTGKRELADIKSRIAQIDNRINAKIKDFDDEKIDTDVDILNNAMRDKSELSYPIPVPGVQRQKKDERNGGKLPSENDLYPHIERVAEEPVVPENLKEENIGPSKAEKRALRRQEKEERKAEKRAARREFIASLPQKIERFNLRETLKRAIHREEKNDWPGRTYSVPDSLKRLGATPDLIDESIASIHGASVQLLDLGRNGNPITQNSGVPLVVAEIKQDVIRDGRKDTDMIRIPFYLSTGTEDNSNRPTGHWYPLFGVMADGELFINEEYNTQELAEIAHQLDEKYGDVRNWNDDMLTEQRKMSGRQGTVGGSDVIQHVDPQEIKRLLGDTLHNGKTLYHYNEDCTYIDGSWLRMALEEMAENWEEQQRIARKNKHKQNRQEFIGHVGAGIRNLWDRLSARYYDEDDSNER